MKRRIIVLLFLVNIIICVCSCKIQTDNDDITPVRTGLKFEDVVDMCGSVIGLDIESYCEVMGDNFVIDHNDYLIAYSRDYSSYLERLARQDDSDYAFFTPRESQYHIISGVSIEGFNIYYYDDAKWAMEDYCELANEDIDDEIDIRESSYNDGYCFSLYSIYNSKRFSAYYYLGDIVISYLYIIDDEDVEYYICYLDFCDALGLPTSDQITEEVMASVP